jgi:hypothetical protein
MGSDAASGTVASGNVAERVLLDLKGVHARLLAEAQFEFVHPRSNKEKGKHLLFLFQRDLLPGVSGQILESKGQRDNIAVKPVPWEAKAACWAFIGLLNVGMLFYILLFAVSQTEHRQGAWALSFAMWLVVEILFVSSATVLVTHVFVPSLIMRDVNKIKLKLADSIRAFNSNIRKRRGPHGEDQEGPEHFNAASYLFVSTRLAQQWSELREAQIIAQFRTPWPKQSYQRETDVSQSYSKKYTALYRSASIVAIFFLTNLLQIPPALQDMVVQMCSTAVIGYTTLLHIQLYDVYPALVVLPTVLACLVVHFAVQSRRAQANQSLAQMLPAAKEDTEVEHSVDGKSNHSVKAFRSRPHDGAEGKTGHPDSRGSTPPEDAGEGDDVGELHMPLSPPAWHISRKQSVQYGMRVLHSLQQGRRDGVGEDQDDDSDGAEMDDESVSLRGVGQAGPALSQSETRDSGVESEGLSESDDDGDSEEGSVDSASQRDSGEGQDDLAQPVGAGHLENDGSDSGMSDGFLDWLDRDLEQEDDSDEGDGSSEGESCSQSLGSKEGDEDEEEEEEDGSHHGGESGGESRDSEDSEDSASDGDSWDDPESAATAVRAGHA